MGQIGAEDYLTQLTIDHVIHAWDLARGTGGDDRVEPELVQWTYDALAPQAAGWRQAGVFGERVEVGESADPQTKLLAMAGRRG